MHIDFSSIHNHYEQLVFDQVSVGAARYPAIAANAELMADVACVALNRLPARHIRHSVDHAFYLGEEERSKSGEAVARATDYAFEYVQSRESKRIRR